MDSEELIAKSLKKSYFEIEPGDSIFKRRWQRIKNLGRIPLSLVIKLSMFYIKKAAGFKGSPKSLSENYYFLTLINSNARSLSIKKSRYYFRNEDGIKFTARKSPSSDLEVFNQVWGRKEYALVVQLLHREGNSKGLTIVDAGANVGYTTLFFNHAFPDSRIIAIEPDAENFTQLQEHIALNGLLNITPLKLGIWSHRCNLSVVTDFRDNREWSIQVKEVQHETGLQGASLDDLISDYNLENIDLLKVDIEGAEKYLFDDKYAPENFLSKTKVLAIEIHDEEIPRENVYKILDTNGFSHFDSRDLTIAYRASQIKAEP